MHWKNFGGMSSDDRQNAHFSGEGESHEYGVGFLVHKDIMSVVVDSIRAAQDRTGWKGIVVKSSVVPQ